MENKRHVFIDMDGTLTSFENEFGKVDITPDRFTKEFFETRKPCWAMIETIHELFNENEWEYHILSNSPNSESTLGKNIWLNKYFWVDKDNRHFLEANGNGYRQPKVNVIVDYCFEHDIPLRDVVFVDDEIKNLIDCEKVSIESWHTSKVLSKKMR